MKIKDLKIGAQLKFAFGAIIFFVAILSVISYVRNDQIQLQMDNMYNHPLQIRRAIGEIRKDVLSVQSDIRILNTATNEHEIEKYLNGFEFSKSDIKDQIQVLYEKFLGAKENIDTFKQEYQKWDLINDVNIRLIHTGKNNIDDELKRSFEAEEEQQKVMLTELQKIDDFAKKKADELFASSNYLTINLNHRIIILGTIILVLIFLIIYILLQSIRNPLVEFIEVQKRFHDGDLNARNSYSSKNEIGILSASFNRLAYDVQSQFLLNKMTTNISDLMLREDDEKIFFYTTISSLMEHTGSQIAAIYLLSDDKKTFEHFDSIGGDENIKKTFSVADFEGEFGGVLAMRAIQHVQNISNKTRFVFNTINGKFIPHEIITIPIITGKEVIAVISLASINKYKTESIQLINEIHSTMSARIEGIIAYQKNIDFSHKLETQNTELEAQKTELFSQSSELQEQNTELEMQKKQLDESNRLKTNFLATMSHELRTPLNSVIALSGVLNRRLAKKITEEENSYLEVIERNGKNLLALINDILDISRIESGREEIEITKFDTNTLIAEVMSMIEAQAQEKKIELVQTVFDSDLEIKTDVKKLQHILQNLISNAIKFTEKGKVEVKAEHTIKNINITVTDTGIGIAEENIQHIFDEFRQADGSTSRKYGGTGLGLAIAKKYAFLLGGTISVKSTLGKGSEFTLTLPAVYNLENKIIEDEHSSDFRFALKKNTTINEIEASTKTILLVEDSEPAIIQMKDIFGEVGFKIMVARDGAEALKLISNTIPDAMILDLMMPGIDGFEVLNKLRNNDTTFHIPVLILTAKHLTKHDLKSLKENNVHQLIQKGNVNREELLNAITSMVFPKPINLKSKITKSKIEGKPTVLVVEDNADNMTTVRALLGDNYNVIEAIDGTLGIDLAKKKMPNLILMDIALPGLNGIEVFKTIRNNSLLKNIPVIALTASAMTTDRETILSYGFDAYVAKPIDQKIFFKTINEILYGE